MHKGRSLEGLSVQTVATHGKCHNAEVSMDIPLMRNKCKGNIVCKSKRNVAVEHLWDFHTNLELI
jgi:hypothetical protein